MDLLVGFLLFAGMITMLLSLNSQMPATRFMAIANYKGQVNYEMVGHSGKCCDKSMEKWKLVSCSGDQDSSIKVGDHYLQCNECNTFKLAE